MGKYRCHGRQVAAGFALVTSLAVSSAAVAQSSAEAADGSRDLDIDTFSPVPRTEPGLLGLDTPEVGQSRDWSLGLFFHHALEPLVVHRSTLGENGGDAEADKPVLHRSVTLLAGALTLGPVELGATIPFIQQSGREPTFSGIEPANGPTLGNVRLRGKAELLEVEPLSVALAAELAVPTSQEGTFAGAGGLAGGARAVAGVRQGRTRVVINAGARLRETRVLADAEQGNELTYGIGGSYDFTGEVSAVAEVAGALGLDARSTEGVSPLEARGALRYWPERRFGVSIGVGRGLMPGIGSPKLRGFALLSIAPGREPAPREDLPAPEPVVQPQPAAVDPDASSETPDDPEEFSCGEDDGPEAGCPEGDHRLVVIASDRLEAFESVDFRERTAELSPDSYNLLAHVAATLRDDPTIERLTIEGHVYASGDAEADRELSRARAEAVADWLSARGVEADRLGTVAHGSDEPLAGGDDERARQVNERIEFIIEERDEEGGD